ncbi:hypothetical protein [Tropicimonas marinistellae]|uniref:hypothetical protein n=1 Tax=Tropicimonas marinistellae TaxID=1739787 RepID=UPI00082ECFF3|nr:hypothetical protein [Tropicimonas marinistellae]
MLAPRRFLAFLAAALCLVLALNQSTPLSEPARKGAQDAAVAALGVYVALRSVNAVLSIAQEIEVGGSVGVSANAQPLKILEPIDDTVERVAGATFSVALLAGVLAIGIGPVSSLGFLLLALGLAIYAIRGPLHRLGDTFANPVCRAGDASNLTGVVLAILLPLSLAMGGVLGEALTRDQWTESMAKVDEVASYSQSLIGATEDIGLTEPIDPQAEGFLDRLQGALSSAGQDVSDTLAYRKAAGFYVSHADDLLTASLQLIAIFLLRALVLPLTLVVVMVALLRQITRG